MFKKKTDDVQDVSMEQEEEVDVEMQQK